MNLLARFTLASGFAASVALFGATASADMKVAVVDLQRAVMSTEDGLRAQATLKKLFDSRTQELYHRRDELTKQQDDLEKQAKVLSKDALDRRMGELQKQAGEFQRLSVEYNKEFEKKQKELQDPIVEHVQAVIKRLAGADGFDMVVDRQAVPYVRGDLDLTDRVIQMANGGSSAPAHAAAPAPAPAPNAAPK